MQTIFKFESADDVDISLINSIKATFKSKSIVITINEDKTNKYELTDEMKKELDIRLAEDESTYITSEESISILKKKYGL